MSDQKFTLEAARLIHSQLDFLVRIGLYTDEDWIAARDYLRASVRGDDELEGAVSSAFDAFLDAIDKWRTAQRN